MWITDEFKYTHFYFVLFKFYERFLHFYEIIFLFSFAFEKQFFLTNFFIVVIIQLYFVDFRPRMSTVTKIGQHLNIHVFRNWNNFIV